MSKSYKSERELLLKINELQEELEQKKQDLAVFRGELKKANQKIESLINGFSHDLKALQQLQRIMVPVELQKISGVEFSSKFIPSYISGGDYLDIFEHQDHFRFGCIVSSASGYGMSALLMTVLLKFTGRMEAKDGSAPHLMVKKIISEIDSLTKNEEERK